MKNAFVLRHGNMIVAKNTQIGEYKTFGLYELFAQHAEFQKTDDIQSRFYWVDASLAMLMRSGMIFLSPFPPDPRSRLEADQEYIPKDMPQPLYAAYEENLEKMLSLLRKNPKEYRVILALNVQETSGNPFRDMFNLAKEAIQDPLRRLEWKLGGRPFQLPKSQWERFRKDERETYRILQGALGARRLSFSEVDYMLERWACPGEEPPHRSPHDDLTEIGPEQGSVVVQDSAAAVPVFEDTEFNGKNGEIQFQKVYPGEIREGRLSHLLINRLPRGYSQYPDVTALFSILQQRFSFPVELIVEFVPHSWSYLKYALKTTSWIGEARNRSKESKGREADEKNQQTEDDSKTLAKILENQEAPLFRTQFVIRVWAKTEEELLERRKKVAEELKGLNYDVVIPARQLPFFYNTLPGFPRRVGHQYHTRATSEWLAALGPLDGMVLGDREGVYVGDAIPFQNRFDPDYQGLPVLFNIREGARNRQYSFSPAIIHYGGPGGGKSTLANYLLYVDILRGAKALVFDPKNERWAWMFEIPALRDMINLVTLNSEDDKGKLDPLLRVYGGKEDRVAIQCAEDVLNYLAETKNQTYAQLAIGYAVDRVVENFAEKNYTGKRPSMYQVLDILRDYVDGKQVFEFPGGDAIHEKAFVQVAEALAKLEYLKDSTLTQLLFAQGHEDFIDVSKPITLLQVEGLIKSDDEEDPNQVVNTACVMAICDLLQWFISQEAAGRMVVFEELHEFGEKETLRRQVRQLLRKGRSTSNVVQLIVHNHRDIDLDRNLDEEDGESEVRSNLGTRFIYRVPDRGEARKALQLLGIQPDEELVEYMTNIKSGMPSGSFLMRDADGHVGLVRFPLEELDTVLYEAFRTDETATRERKQKYEHLLQKKVGAI